MKTGTNNKTDIILYVHFTVEKVEQTHRETEL